MYKIPDKVPHKKSWNKAGIKHFKQRKQLYLVLRV